MKTITFRGHRLKSKGTNIFGTQDYEYTSKDISIFVDHNKYDYLAIYSFHANPVESFEIAIEAQTLKSALSKLNKKIESLKNKIAKL